MPLSNSSCRLRAVEPQDIDRIYLWENDPSVWPAGDRPVPVSRHSVEMFVLEGGDVVSTGRLRLMIETVEGRCIGAVDLFEFDALNRRAGVGILIYNPADRRRGYASSALRLLCDYCRTSLGMHQLWCTVAAHNEASEALFRSCGFECAGRRRDWFAGHEGWGDALFMQKIL
ncbi:MAG: GNAT family N-acetyltransferase [Alistipes sp.]|nr:GNAT family N-acetyltransferase [Alistipes sp.]